MRLRRFAVGAICASLLAGCAPFYQVHPSGGVHRTPPVRRIWCASSDRSIPFRVIIYKAEDYRHIMSPGMQGDTLDGVYWVDAYRGEYIVSGQMFTERFSAREYRIRIEDDAQGYYRTLEGRE